MEDTEITPSTADARSNVHAIVDAVGEKLCSRSTALHFVLEALSDERFSGDSAAYDYVRGSGFPMDELTSSAENTPDDMCGLLDELGMLFRRMTSQGGDLSRPDHALRILVLDRIMRRWRLGRYDTIPGVVTQNANIQVKADRYFDDAFDAESPIRSNNLDALSAKLHPGANINFRDAMGQAAAHLAAGYGRVEILRWLCRHGAFVNARDWKWRTPLIAALVPVSCSETLLDCSFFCTPTPDEEKRNVVIAFLLDNGADANARDLDGRTPIMLTAEFEKTASAELLLAHGANINASDNNGDTLLHMAARSDNAVMVHFACEHGADLNGLNRAGQSPLVCAIERNNMAIADILIRAGASPVPTMPVRKLETCSAGVIPRQDADADNVRRKEVRGRSEKESRSEHLVFVACLIILACVQVPACWLFGWYGLLVWPVLFTIAGFGERLAENGGNVWGAIGVGGRLLVLVSVQILACKLLGWYGALVYPIFFMLVWIYCVLTEK